MDRSGAVLYDKLCRPGRPVKDYNTRYSGITAEMLAQTSTTLKDIQQASHGSSKPFLRLYRPSVPTIPYSVAMPD